MVERHNTFSFDKLLRDKNYRPVGRAVLMNEFSGEDKVYCVLLTAPKEYISDVRGHTFYIDGVGYQIAKDTPEIRFTKTPLSIQVNTFYLEKVE